MPDVRVKKIDENEIDTILADDIDFSGVVSFEKPLMVKGCLKGEISANGDLYVDEGAVIEAEIKANMVSAKGKINGNIVAMSKVELSSTAMVTGDIIAPKIEIETGALFNGKCIMKEVKKEDTYEHQ